MKKKILYIIIFITIIISFFLMPQKIKDSNYNLNLDTTNIINLTTEDELQVSEDINLEEYRNKYNNFNIIARLEIPNIFNILITQYQDNTYYLNHNLYNKKDEKGTEFLDYRLNNLSNQINIYGHNSKTYNLPFTNIEKYLSEDFFINNPYIIYQYDEGKRYYKIISFKEINNDYEHMQVNPSNIEEHLDKLISNSIYTRDIQYNNDSNIIILQTCSYNNDNYYLLIGIEVEHEKYTS